MNALLKLNAGRKQLLLSALANLHTVFACFFANINICMATTWWTNQKEGKTYSQCWWGTFQQSTLLGMHTFIVSKSLTNIVFSQIIVYDFGCNLREYMLNREPILFRDTQIFIDRFHYKNHKCSTLFSLDFHLYPSTDSK